MNTESTLDRTWEHRGSFNKKWKRERTLIVRIGKRQLKYMVHTVAHKEIKACKRTY